MTEKVAAILLAGGLAQRMGGGDKMLLEVEGKTLLDRVIERARPQVTALLLNVNGDPSRFARFDLPVRGDLIEGHAGPLAGILTGLEWVRANLPEVRWLASFATDTPLVPTDFVDRLLAAIEAEGADIGCATSGGTRHPVFGLWPVRLADELRHALTVEGIRKIDLWTSRYRVADVEWPGGNTDPFFNVNTPEDITRLRLILKGALPADPPAHAALPVAVLVDWSKSSHPWGSDIWQASEVVPALPTRHAWQLLRQDGGKALYLADDLTLELHRSDLASYRYNLTSRTPQLFVLMRPGEDGLRPTLITAAPDEAEALMEVGETIDAVPLPPWLAQWMTSFTAQHPPDPPVKKRQRDRYDPNEHGRRPAGERR